MLGIAEQVDLLLDDEDSLLVGADPDAGQRTTVLRAGTYQVDIEPCVESAAQRWKLTRNGEGKVTHGTARIKATITEGSSLGRVVFGNVTTKIGANGGCSAFDLLGALGRDEEKRSAGTQKALMAEIDKVLDHWQSAHCRVKVDVEATEIVEVDGRKTYTTLVRREKDFPTNAEGEPLFDGVEPKNGGQIRVDSVINWYVKG